MPSSVCITPFGSAATMRTITKDTGTYARNGQRMTFHRMCPRRRSMNAALTQSIKRLESPAASPKLGMSAESTPITTTAKPNPQAACTKLPRKQMPRIRANAAVSISPDTVRPPCTGAPHRA